MKQILCLMAILLVVTLAKAQQDCPEIVEVALESAREGCSDLELNEACYGSSFIEAEARPYIDEFVFLQSGDRADILAIDRMRLSAMDTRAGTWGIALMEVQSQQDEADGATLLLFGDAALQSSDQLLTVETTQPTQVYAFPQTDSAILETVAINTTIIANGRLETGDWLRVWLPEGAIGWLSAAQMVTPEDLNLLPVIALDQAMIEPEANNSALYGPMQAFYFESGTNDAPCANAPESGMLIQTPEGEASVTIWMDEVVVQLDGTVYVQAQADGDMALYLLEGSAQVEAQDASRTAIAGTVVMVPLDQNLTASGAPSEPAPYDAADLAGLPTDLLPENVSAAAPLEWQEGLPLNGVWMFHWEIEEMLCPDGTRIPFEIIDMTTAVEVEPDGSAMNVLGIRHLRLEQGVYGTLYADEIGNVYQNTIRVTALDQMAGESAIDFGVCQLSAPFTLQLQHPN